MTTLSSPSLRLREPSLRTRAFYDGALLFLLLAMAAVRLRVHEHSPLPSRQPILWLAQGLAEDAAITGLVAVVLLAVACATPSDGWARWLFGAFCLCLVTVEILWGEVLIFFGQVPRPDVLAAGMNRTFARGVAQGPAVVGAVLFLLLFSLLLFASSRRGKRASRAWSRPVRLMLAALAATAVALFPVPIHHRDTARNPVVALAVTWKERSGTDSKGDLAPPRPRLSPLAVRELAPGNPQREYLTDLFPLAHRPPARSALAPRLPEGLRPNFVFILMEGVRAEEVGAYGGRPPGLTPNLDRLARDGVLIERAYSPGMHTPEAELALWYGILPNPYASLMTAHPEARLTGLPEILRAAGWRSFLWIHNGDQTFYRRDRFYLPRGFRMLDGRDFPPEDCRTNWGYSDRALARRAVEALDRTQEPFAAMALTVSNHHPFQVPSDARTSFPGLPPPRRGFLPFLDTNQQIGMHTIPMIQTIHYTDEAIGDFFRLAEKRTWFPRTVFVIAGDHGLSIAPYARPITTLSALTSLRHRVPMILFSPMLRPGRVSGPASQADIPETLLALAGISSPRTGTGRDLLDPTQSDPDRRIVTWSPEGRLATVVGSARIYHAVVAGEVLSGGLPIRFREEILFDPTADPDGKRDLTAGEPQTAQAYRRLADVYLDVYGWLLVSGRAGLPEGILSDHHERAGKEN